MWWSRNAFERACRYDVILMAPHGYLHGGTLVSVADSLCGYGTIVNLPDDATGFITIELKSNFSRHNPARRNDVQGDPCAHGPHHADLGCRRDRESGNRTLSIFSCSQLILRDGR